MCSTYLAFFMRDDLLDEMPMFPYPDAPSGGGSGGDSSAETFMAPSVTSTYDQVAWVAMSPSFHNGEATFPCTSSPRPPCVAPHNGGYH